MEKTLLYMLLVYLLASCQSKPKDGRTDTFDSGVIGIAVDESFLPVIQEEIDVFESLAPLAGIVPHFTTEGEAISLLLKDSVRLAIATRQLTALELESFHSRKFQPRQMLMAIDGVALIVNNANRDTLISVPDIRRIMTGEVTRWKELYPASPLGEINFVFDNRNSSTVRYAIDSICGGKPLSSNLRALYTNEEVIDYVARTPDAIGVVGVNWLNDRVRAMSVSSIHPADADNACKPHQAYLYYGIYPLRRNLYILVNDPRGALSWGFASFLVSERGQRIVLKSGLVPATQPVNVRSVNIRPRL